MIIFSVSLYNNDYEKKELHQICIKSWEKIKKQVEQTGESCEIKIIGTDSELYKEYIRVPNRHRGTKAVQADCFRMFCLSKLPHSIYLDLDVFCSDAFVFQKKTFIRNSFWYIQNNNDCTLFENIYKEYLTGKFSNKQDKNVFSSFFPGQNIKPPLGLSHLYKFYNRPAATLLFSEDVSEVASYREDRKVTAVSKKEYIQGAMNLWGDSELIEFVENLQKKVV